MRITLPNIPVTRGNLFRSIFLLFIVSCSLQSFSQNLEKKITLKAREKPLGELLLEISRKGNINFSYNPQSIPIEKPVTIHAGNKSIRSILEEILGKNGIRFFTLENQVVLKMNSSSPELQTTDLPLSRPKYSISGFLKEKSTGEVMIGANVYAKGTSLGTTSNAYGFFSLTLPSGHYSIVISFIGYKEVIREIDLIENLKFSADLEEVQLDIPGVEIVAGSKVGDIPTGQMGDFSFSSRTLAQLPGFAGDLDIIKALQAVPGIRSYGDGSALFYVRGGNNDQNMILIDEAPIYNPSHLFGFFSVLAPDAIHDMQVYKGDFPARYGGRLSSVVDIKAREGNLKRFGFSGNLGPYASSLTLEGPIVKDKSSFIVSGRLSTLNWLNFLTNDKRTFNLNFFDINAKLNLKLNENNRFFFTFYGGQDNFSRIQSSTYKTFGISWNNLAGTFRWNHVFNSKLFSNTTLNYSQYRYYLYISQEQDDYWKSSVANLTLKTDFTWYLNPGNTLRSGLEITSHRSDPGNVTLTGNNAREAPPQVAEYQAMEYVFYLSNEQSVGNFSLRYGIRMPLWQDIGPTTVYYFNVNHQVSDTLQVAKNSTYATFLSPEPRVSVLYHINDKNALKATYCRTTQFLQVLSNATGPFNSVEVWAPSGPNIKPQKADQFALGYFRKLFKTRVTFSTEVYYKQFYNHIDYKDHANMLYNPLIEGELRFGSAWSYGLELMLRKNTGKLTGWIGYTFSRSFVRTEGVNNGNTYPANYDSPNNICFNISYDTRKHWSFSANWYYLTGGAITTPIGFYYVNGYSVPVYGDKNNDRLPDYHRLDLSVAFRISKPEKRFQHSVILTLYNAYGRMNPFSVSFNKFKNDKGEFLVPSNQDGSYELVPTTISVAGIIPSINYQFKF